MRTAMSEPEKLQALLAGLKAKPMPKVTHAP